MASDNEKLLEIYADLFRAHSILVGAAYKYEEFGSREEILELQTAALKLGRVAVNLGTDLDDTPGLVAEGFERGRKEGFAAAEMLYKSAPVPVEKVKTMDAPPATKRKGMSAAGRKAVSDAQKARWAAKKVATKTVPPAVKKRRGRPAKSAK